MSKGFTLLELVAIILLLGILTVVAVTRIGTISDFSGEAALNRVKADLKYIREFAINNSCRTRVSYNTAGNTSYTAAKYISSSWQDMVDPTTNTSPFIITLNQGPYTGIKITSVNFDGQNTIEFDSIGRPYSYDGISATLLLNDGLMNLTGGLSISVTADTGRID